VDEVEATVRHAAGSGLRVSTQATGHGAAGLSGLDGTILLKPVGLDLVEVNAEGRNARAGAGVEWGSLTPQATELGLTPLSGSAADVGIAGYTLGGGLSFLSRKHGLACNSVTAIEGVTAAGERFRADAETEPDLFWAMRGGGGGFAVATAFEFDLCEVPRLYSGMLAWPWERAEEVLQAWRESLPSFPDEMSTVGRVMQFPPFPEIPEQLRGRAMAIVEVIYLGEKDHGGELIAPLRALDPEIDTVAQAPLSSLEGLHMDPPGPVAGISDHLLLEHLTEEGVAALVEAVGSGSGSTLISAELRHLGGAIGRAPENAGALAQIDGEVAMFAVGVAADEQLAAKTTADLAGLRGALAPWDAGSVYLNFSDFPVAAKRIFTPDTCVRLQEVKSRYDPDDLFRANG